MLTGTGLDRKTGQAQRRTAVYWLVVKNRPDHNEHKTQRAERAEKFTVKLYARKRALAVFSFKEEAQMFAGLVEDGADWRVSEIAGEDLLEVLRGPSPNTDFVALDPFPERIAPETANLVSVSGEYFAHHLLRQMQKNRADPSSQSLRASDLDG